MSAQVPLRSRTSPSTPPVTELSNEMPRPTDTESRLQSRIDAFVDEISAIVREAAVEAVRSTLMAGGGVPVPRRGKAGATKKGAARKAAKAARKKTKSGRRVRRSAADLETLGARFLAHVKSHPGLRLEQIAKSLRRDTADLKRPVTLLMEAKKLRTEGQKRGTKYFAGKKRVGKKRKAAKRKAKRKVAKKAA